MSLFNRERPQQDGSRNLALSTAVPVVGEKPAPRASNPAPATSGGPLLSRQGLIVIGETAVVTAQINAGSVVVAGKVSGDITATQLLELHPFARVVGNLASPILVIHEGATFEGHCTTQPEAARGDRRDNGRLDTPSHRAKADRSTNSGCATECGG
jgi:cytoskeletal protein CcmA (bactofilin family)